MKKLVKCYRNFWLWDPLLSHWRMASINFDDVVNDVAFVSTEGFCAYAFAARLKRGARLHCAYGHCRVAVRVAGKPTVLVKDPQIGSVLVAAGDIRSAIFPLSHAINSLDAPMPQLRSRQRCGSEISAGLKVSGR